MPSSLVALPEFLQSTRHAGYRSPAHAVAELVDNAIQAGAGRVGVQLLDGPAGLEVRVLDDGAGMDAACLAQALRFGGSSRYGDRGGLGRFGMGLPTSSLSQARRVEVCSWQCGVPPHGVALDLDEVIGGHARLVVPSRQALPPDVNADSKSGTLVRWIRCDRLVGHRASALATGLALALGRTFRRFLWDGLCLTVNGVACPAIDPMLLDPRSPFCGAQRFGEPLRLRLRTTAGAGEVVVTFSELPVQEWHALSNAEKRRRGVTKGAGVSVLRANREVDTGWLFMGEKRRENYDDWWRCEVAFPPALDEAFGLTYTKQQVRPSQEVIDALTPEISVVAHALNGRARRAHKTVQTRARYAASEAHATEVESRMPPLPLAAPPLGALAERLVLLFPDVLRSPPRPDIRIVEDDLGPGPLFEVVRVPNRLVVVWNTAHPFYVRAYAPLAASDEPGSAERRAHLELFLVALARAEAARGKGRAEVEAFRVAWSGALAELVKE